MRKLRYIFLIVIAFAFSCNEISQYATNENSADYIDINKLEIEIISQTLNDLVGFKPIKNVPLVRNVDETGKEYQKRLEIEENESEKLLKKNGLSFYLYDTLFVPQKQRMNGINDTMYNGLAIQLLSDTLRPKYIELSKIHIDSINFLLKRPKLNEIKIGYCGYAGFSRIIFNEEFDKAFFYFYMDCGSGLCGSGHFIYVEKKKGNWIIIRNDQIWIS